MSHYIPAFTEVNGHSQRAACGVWVRAEEHSTEPTCEGCKAYVESEAATANLTADDVFGTFSPDDVVKAIHFDPCKDYAERRR